jgi:cytochrome c2
MNQHMKSFLSVIRKFTPGIIAAACFFALCGCEYEVPLTAKPTRKIDEKLVGDWISTDGKEKMKVRRLDDSIYIVSYNGDLFGAFHSDVAKTSFVSVQDIDSADRKYAYLTWKLSDDGKRLGLRVAVGGADGRLYFLTGDGTRVGEVAAGPRPVISIAISPDGMLAAAAGIGGSVAVIDRKARLLARTLVGPGLPVWSVAFLPDSRTLLTGGADNIIRRWNAVTGDPVDPMLLETAGDPLAAYAGDRGAEIFRACVACHTLGSEQINRAGPTLAGLFGRRIATLPGYNFSEALKRLDIVWTPETVSRLFEIGPSAYTPGTKMPEQRIGSEQDRAALVQFLERATKR